MLIKISPCRLNFGHEYSSKMLTPEKWKSKIKKGQ